MSDRQPLGVVAECLAQLDVLDALEERDQPRRAAGSVTAIARATWIEAVRLLVLHRIAAVTRR